MSSCIKRSIEYGGVEKEKREKKRKGKLCVNAGGTPFSIFSGNNFFRRHQRMPVGVYCSTYTKEQAPLGGMRGHKRAQYGEVGSSQKTSSQWGGSIWTLDRKTVDP